MMLSTAACSIDAALAEVSNLEATVKKILMGRRVSVKILPSCHQILILISGKEFLGNLDVKLIHQLGSKIWKNLSQTETVRLWKKHLRSDLPHLLEVALVESDSVLRYVESGGVRRIYGITSSYFVEMNQSVFRDTLVKSLDGLGITPNAKVQKTPFGEVVEEFSVQPRGGQVGLSCKAIYGLNNGYSSYRLSWGRIVLVCANGLTAFRDIGRNRWVHTDRVDIGDFALASANAAYNHLPAVEKQIVDARERSINYSLLDQFMTRLAIANASKERISARLHHEFSDTGPNEWSVSQALTFLGQHEKAIPFRVKDDLTRLGSTLLEKPLAQVVSSPAVITPAGFYDILR